MQPSNTNNQITVNWMDVDPTTDTLYLAGDQSVLAMKAGGPTRNETVRPFPVGPEGKTYFRLGDQVWQSGGVVTTIPGKWVVIQQEERAVLFDKAGKPRLIIPDSPKSLATAVISGHRLWALSKEHEQQHPLRMWDLEKVTKINCPPTASDSLPTLSTGNQATNNQATKDEYDAWLLSHHLRYTEPNGHRVSLRLKNSTVTPLVERNCPVWGDESALAIETAARRLAPGYTVLLQSTFQGVYSTADRYRATTALDLTGINLPTADTLCDIPPIQWAKKGSLVAAHVGDKLTVWSALTGFRAAQTTLKTPSTHKTRTLFWGHAIVFSEQISPTEEKVTRYQLPDHLFD